MSSMYKLSALLLTLTVLAGCATRPPQEHERVVPLPGKTEQPAPERPAPPPMRPAQPSTVPTPAPAAPPATELPDSSATPTPPPVRSAVPAMSPAAKSLMVKADQASAAGKHDEAAGYLERALRISPQHPVLWQNLAVVRYRQRDFDKVEGLALKSNSLAASAPALRKTNWELIATVRRMKGNLRGAQAAADEARKLATP